MFLTDQPIVLVDGIRIDNSVVNANNSEGQGGPISRINDINPDDIQSIEVIKGPAASTLYGTQAANGVIPDHHEARSGRGPPPPSSTLQTGSTWFQDPAGRFPYDYALDPTTGAVDSLNPYTLSVQQGQAAYRAGLIQNYDLNVASGTAARAVTTWTAATTQRTTGRAAQHELW